MYNKIYFLFNFECCTIRKTFALSANILDTVVIHVIELFILCIKLIIILRNLCS